MNPASELTQACLERIETRDTLINEERTMVVNWNYYYSQQRTYTTHGVLYWEDGDEILGPRFIDQA